MIDQQLFEYYLSLREPEAYEWNLSPKNLYVEYITRDYISNNFHTFEGMKVCNVGIGVGEWDDYLGFLLKNKGKLTSIDIDPDICKVFEGRQLKEGHPNPSFVVCEDIVDTTIEEGEFDLVTIIGSTLKETQQYEKTLKKCFSLLNDNGRLVYMDFERYHSSNDFEEFIAKSNHRIIQKNIYQKYQDYAFYIYQSRR